MATGKIVQVQRPVVDIAFEPGQLPPILNAIRIPQGDAHSGNGASGDGTGQVNLADTNDLVVEVAQHLGNDVVRCVAMASTDGLVRGQIAIDNGAAIAVPVG